jgi:hypothetical protein
MSSAKIGGVVAGIVVLVAMLCGIAFILARKRIRRSRAMLPKETINEKEKPPVPPYHSRPHFRTAPAKMEAGNTSELAVSETETLVQELDGRECTGRNG